MRCADLKLFFEPVGLLLLLFAFGWQCVAEHSRQAKVESYFYEFDQKLYNLWIAAYDEAVHSDRYDGSAMVSVNYDALYKMTNDWQDIQKGLETIDSQTAFFSWARAVLFVLGSLLVILAKWPQKRSEYGCAQ